jgi:hypothetical protein
MKTLTRESLSDLYVVAIIALLGIVAFFSSILIAWPALAYLGSKMFM